MSDQDITAEEVDAFLAELGALTLRHRIAIGGCGCCGSPWLQRIEPPQGAHGYVRTIVPPDSFRALTDRIGWRWQGAPHISDRPDYSDEEQLVPPQGAPR